MYSVAFDRAGEAAVLRWRQEDGPPDPGPREVLIEVRAAGVNNADVLQRRGLYPLPHGAPPGLGLECSGVLAALGEDVSGWQIGDRVCALLLGGGYASHVLASVDHLLAVPDGMELHKAAALPEAAATVYSNLAMLAGVGTGSRVLFHGGGSGVASLGVQWAHAIGARVLATVGSDERLRRVERLGADVAINYRRDDFVRATLEATDGEGVDAVLDLVGAPYLTRNLRCLAPDGHLVMIGGDLGPAELDLSAMLGRRASVSATLLRSRPHRQKAAILAGVRENLWPLVWSGAIEPVVDSVFPMAAAAAAHQHFETEQVFGKVLLTIPTG